VVAVTAPKKLDAAPYRNRLGYYVTPYGRFLSVTTIISKGVPKPALPFWAANETARAALDNVPMLARARTDAARIEAYDFLRGAANRVRDDAGDLGTAIHAAINADILGKPWPEPTDEQRPFLQAFHRFVADWHPEWEATELVVAHPEDEWAGTCDWWAWLNLPDLGRTLVCGDSKSGKPDRQREKPTYPETAMQLSAYRRAKVAWLRDGTEVEPPRAEHAVVLHLRPDHYPARGYALAPVDTSDDVYRWFLAARDVARGDKELAKTAIGEPFPYPAPAHPETEVA
jgi:hypothetical protein